MNEKLLRKLPLIIFGIIVLGPLLRKGNFLFFVIIIAIVFFIFQEKNIKLNIFKNLNKLKNNNSNMNETIDIDKIKSNPNLKKILGGGIILILLLWLFFSSIIIIDAGETGVYSLFGKVKEEELSSGFHLVIPLARIHKMSVRTEEYTMSILSGEGKINRDDSIRALTKEGLDVDLDITVLYRLEESQAAYVYRYLGLNYEQKIIRPEIRSSIREIIANYEAKDIYSEKRQEAVAKIVENLKAKLEPQGIVLEDVLLRNVQLPSDLAKSIQEKLRAEQEAQKYDFILEKESKEKERKIIEAEGQRESQKIINESLTQNYLYYSYIKELKDREGTIYVPTSPSTGMPLFRNLGN